MEQGSGEVRVMTVHGAKGLEAPIVILPDTTMEQGKADSLLMLGRGDGFAKLPLWVVPTLFASRAVATSSMSAATRASTSRPKPAGTTWSRMR